MSAMVTTQWLKGLPTLAEVGPVMYGPQQEQYSMLQHNNLDLMRSRSKALESRD